MKLKCQLAGQGAYGVEGRVPWIFIKPVEGLPNKYGEPDQLSDMLSKAYQLNRRKK